MYSLHHLTQSSTVQKELPAGLLPPRQLGFCPRSGSHWYNHKYNCLASLPAACTLGYPGIPESLYPFSLMDVKKHGSGSVGVIRHMNFPFCSIQISQVSTVPKRSSPFFARSLAPSTDPGSISVSFRKNRRPESDRFSFEPTLTCRLFPSSQSYQLFCGTAIQCGKPALLSSYPTQS